RGGDDTRVGAPAGLGWGDRHRRAGRPRCRPVRGGRRALHADRPRRLSPGPARDQAVRRRRPGARLRVALRRRGGRERANGCCRERRRLSDSERRHRRRGGTGRYFLQALSASSLATPLGTPDLPITSSQTSRATDLTAWLLPLAACEQAPSSFLFALAGSFDWDWMMCLHSATVALTAGEPDV